MAKCDGCGSEFAARAGTRFCSRACRQRSQRGESRTDSESRTDYVSRESESRTAAESRIPVGAESRMAAAESSTESRTGEPESRVESRTAPAESRTGSEIVAGILAAADGSADSGLAADPGVVGKLIESGAVTLGPAEPMPAQGKVPAGFGGENHRGHKIFPHNHEWEREASGREVTRACFGLQRQARDLGRGIISCGSGGRRHGAVVATYLEGSRIARQDSWRCHHEHPDGLSALECALAEVRRLAGSGGYEPCSAGPGCQESLCREDWARIRGGAA